MLVSTVVTDDAHMFCSTVRFQDIYQLMGDYLNNSTF